MRKFLVTIVLLVLVYLASSLIFQLIYPVPDTSNRENSTAEVASEDTWLGRTILPRMRENPGRSGISGLLQGPNAFAARILLADTAESTIDIRYYIWQKDITGLLLLDAVQRAAERGVRVRLLLDDNGIAGLDLELAEMNAHPNIEVRLFNPFVLRSPRIASYLLDFNRVNRRMHNKSFTVDGVATIVGGRNIGDIYFYRSDTVNYFDLDVVALGDAATRVGEDFDLYWASPSAIPIEALLPAANPDGGVLDASVAQVRAAPGGTEYDAAIRDSTLIGALDDDSDTFDWVELDLVSDDPAKGQGKVTEDLLMHRRLSDILDQPETSVDLVSAYFIPGENLRNRLSQWAQAGLTVRTLTNAQEATDVLPVHAGYRKYRQGMLANGIKMYELKSAQERLQLRKQFGFVGSKNSSLHAKTFVLDNRHIFVGSFNFDPRSVSLNTEMGFMIKDAELARLLSG